MNSYQLQDILSADAFANSVFCGVKPRDYFISEKVRLPGSYIVNTDKSTQPGKHWVAIYLTGEGTAEYFDSYGLPPLQADVRAKLTLCSDKIKYNDYQLQGTTTTVCGHYCLLYCLMRARGCSFEEVLRVFRPELSTETRDHLIASFVKSEYEGVLRARDKDYQTQVHISQARGACKY